MPAKKAAQKEEPLIVPLATRPRAPSEKKEDGSVIVAKQLAGNLGTAPEIAQAMQIDERKMANLNPEIVTSLAYFDWRGKQHGVRFYKHFVPWELVGSQAIGGLGKRQILAAIQASSGSQVIERAKAPNAIARNLWDRNWKEKAVAEGKQIE